MGDYDGGAGADFDKSALGKIIPELTEGVVYTGDGALDAQLFAKQFRAAEISDDEECLEDRDIDYKFTDPPPTIEEYKKMRGVIELASNGMVLKRIIKKGYAGRPPKGCKLFYIYAAFLDDQKKPFDASTYHEKMSSSIVGDETHILGFKYALESMKLGELAQFYIHYDYAFGEIGSPPRIPPKSNIFVNIQIKDFHDLEMMNSIEFMEPEKRRTLPFQEVLAAAKTVKAYANEYLNNNSFSTAVRLYRKAIYLVEDHWDVSEALEKDRQEFREVCYSNMAQAYIKLNKAPQACNACKMALNSGSDLKVVKTYFRFANAQIILKDYDRALSLIKQGAKYLDGGEKHKVYLQYEKDIKDMKHTEKMKEMNLYKKMLSPQERVNLPSHEQDIVPIPVIASSSKPQTKNGSQILIGPMERINFNDVPACPSYCEGVGGTDC